MKRTVEPDCEFNKEYFAKVLEPAIGGKSISEFTHQNIECEIKALSI